MGPRIFRLTASLKDVVPIAAPVAGGQFAVFLSAPVGDALRCRNLAEDVTAVQAALNRFSEKDGGPIPRLEVDGVYGRHTKEAIYRFQRKWALEIERDGVRRKVADGVVDPEGPTIDRLRAGPGDDIASTAQVERARPVLSNALVAAVEAIAEVAEFYRNEAAWRRTKRPVGPSFEAFERNFHASRYGEKPQMSAFVQSKIRLMRQVFADSLKSPDDTYADDFASSQESSIAFTWEGGYRRHEAGDDAAYARYRKDKIYFCPFSRALNDIGISYVLAHELSHFVDEFSDDYAYFHRNRPRYAALNPVLCMHNADSFAQFVFEVGGFGELDVLQHVSIGGAAV